MLSLRVRLYYERNGVKLFANLVLVYKINFSKSLCLVYVLITNKAFYFFDNNAKIYILYTYT